MLTSILGPGLSHAEDTVIAEEATVIKEFGCIITPQASGLPSTLFTTDTHSVVTPSGNTVLKCFFDIPEIMMPSSTMRHTGFLCNTYLGLTTNSMAVTNVGGQVALTCQIKANSN